jgi:GNAT superfamily N-acetyltransferase
MRWRPMTAGDLRVVGLLANAIHVRHPEDAEVFAERWRLYPAGCHVLADGGEAPVGYAIGHPWFLGAPPPLNSLLGALPDRGDTLFIHDVAMLQAARGRGAAAEAAELLLAQGRAEGLSTASLVAIAGAHTFWSRLGFAEVPLAGLHDAAKGYGGDARYMIRPISR